jgi:alpha,alpha-trehalase
VTGVDSSKDPVVPQALRDYALLGDGERGAVVGPHGEIVWMCAPRWESDAVFASLVGGEGVYAVTPKDRFVWGGYYEEGTLIWRSRWVTGEGIVECREALQRHRRA